MKYKWVLVEIINLIKILLIVSSIIVLVALRDEYRSKTVARVISGIELHNGINSQRVSLQATVVDLEEVGQSLKLKCVTNDEIDILIYLSIYRGLSAPEVGGVYLFEGKSRAPGTLEIDKLKLLRVQRGEKVRLIANAVYKKNGWVVVRTEYDEIYFREFVYKEFIKSQKEFVYVSRIGNKMIAENF